MAIPCDICGKENHPWFDCPRRSTKPADWKPDRLKAKPVSAGASTKPRGRSTSAGRGLVTQEDAASANHSAPAVAGSIPAPVDYPILKGATFIAEIPPGTQLKAFGNKVIAAGPNLMPSIVTKDGLVPIMSEKDLKPKDERKGNRHRPGYHKDHRAKLKAAKESK